MHRLDARQRRARALERSGYNLTLLPEELLEVDCLTDSLMHRAFSIPEHELEQGYDTHQRAAGPEEKFQQLFDFPHVLAVSQGRLAEAALSRALVRNGHYVLGSALFPSTRLHQERQGGSVLEVMIPEAQQLDSPHPFKGNIDLQKLEHAILTYHPSSIPYLYLEPCNNAVGGHPFSLANLRGIRALSDRYGIAIYLDACRLLDNALLVQQREVGYSDTPVLDIAREFCSLVDGCTLSATKDFPAAVGGFLATRDKNVFERCADEILLLGAGLSRAGRAALAQALCHMESNLTRVQQRATRVATLHRALGPECGLTQPAGAHALFLDLGALKLDIPEPQQPAQAFLCGLFSEHGIRGALNPPSATLAACNVQLLRFALPIVGVTELHLTTLAHGIRAMQEARARLPRLRKLAHSGGLAAGLNATYELAQPASNL